MPIEVPLECEGVSVSTKDNDDYEFDPRLEVDPLQAFRATKMPLCSCIWPHMSSFHFSWISFLVAFMGWFALAPLAPVIKEDLDLSLRDIYTADMTVLLSTIFARYCIRPLCVKYGPKMTQCSLLLLGTICVGCGALVTSAEGLIVVRFFTGIVGASFFPCQYWSSLLFTKAQNGNAEAIASGWGNFGGGLVQIVMALVYSAILSSGVTVGFAWRLSLAVPAGLLFVTTVAMYFSSVDSAIAVSGRKMHPMSQKSVVTTSFEDKAFTDPAAWILAAQYGGSLGVQMVVYNVMTLYFFDKFNLTLIQAAACATCCGVTNLFARAYGAILSNTVNSKFGMKGRLLVHWAVLFLEGIAIIVFSKMNDLAAAVVVLVIFSTFAQLAAGTTYAIVPAVNPPIADSISSFVGVGGNVGGVVWSIIFLCSGLSAQDTIEVIGICVVVLSLLSVFIFIKGDYDGIFCNPRKSRTIGW